MFHQNSNPDSVRVNNILHLISLQGYIYLHITVKMRHKHKIWEK